MDRCELTRVHDRPPAGSAKRLASTSGTTPIDAMSINAELSNWLAAEDRGTVVFSMSMVSPFPYSPVSHWPYGDYVYCSTIAPLASAIATTL